MLKSKNISITHEEMDNLKGNDWNCNDAINRMFISAIIFNQSKVTTSKPAMNNESKENDAQSDIKINISNKINESKFNLQRSNLQ